MGNVCTSQKSVSAFEPFQSATGVTTPVSPQMAPGIDDSEHQTVSTSTEIANRTVEYEDAPLPAESTSTATAQQAAGMDGLGTTSLETQSHTEHSDPPAQESPEVSQETSSSEPPPFSPPANYRAKRRCSVRALIFPMEYSLSGPPWAPDSGPPESSSLPSLIPTISPLQCIPFQQLLCGMH